MADPHVFIQWKGTDVCMDVTCPRCGTDGHVDGGFARFVRCGNCGMVAELGTAVTVTPIDTLPEHATTPVLIKPSDPDYHL